jgi:hypothetical protein
MYMTRQDCDDMALARAVAQTTLDAMAPCYRNGSRLARRNRILEAVLRAGFECRIALAIADETR